MLAFDPVILGALGGIFGLLGGAFLTVVVHRGPGLWDLTDPAPPPAGHERVTLAVPGSHCPACLAPLTPIEIVPLLGYLLRRGKCGHCGTRIPAVYPLLEGLGAAAGATAFLIAGPTGLILGALMTLALLLLLGLAVIDARTGYLPDMMTLPLIGIGLLAAALGLTVSFTQSVIGAALGYGVFRGIAALYEVLRGRMGLGGGDAKLLGGIGAVAGPFVLPPVILLGSLSALAVVGITALIRRKGIAADQSIRFGPYLAGSGAVLILWLMATGFGAP